MLFRSSSSITNLAYYADWSITNFKTRLENGSHGAPHEKHFEPTDLHDNYGWGRFYIGYLALLVLCVDVCAFSDQKLRQLLVPVLRRDVECVVPVLRISTANMSGSAKVVEPVLRVVHSCEICNIAS